MDRQTQEYLLDQVLPGWRSVQERGGETRHCCPLHNDKHPSLRLRGSTLTWFCDPCGDGGGVWDLARKALGEARAREIVRQLGPAHAGQPREPTRTPTTSTEPRQHEIEDLGEPTPKQIAALVRSRRLRDGDALRSFGARRVRAFGRDWLGLPTLVGGWKLWAIEKDGRPRLDDSGRLERRNFGPASIIMSPELKANSTDIRRLFDLEGESDLVAGVEAGLNYAITGTAGAASLKGHEAHREQLLALAPEEVVVVRDLDRAGRDGAEKAAEFWLGLGIPVRVLELPDSLGEGGDLRDYLAGKPARNGSDATPPLGGKDDLEKLANQAELREPADRGFEYFEGSSGNAAATEPSWEPPSEFDNFALPEFPLEALPPALADYVAELAKTHQVPISIPGDAALGAVSGAIARKVEIQIGDTHHEQVNLWFATIAGSGERKRVIRELEAPLHRAERELIRGIQPKIAEAKSALRIADERIRSLEKDAAKADDRGERESLTRSIARIQAELPVVPAEPQLVADDATPEALGQIMGRQQERIILFSEEGGSFFGNVGGRYSQTGDGNLDLCLKAFDGGSVRVGRVHRSTVTLDRPALTVVLTLQPSLLQKIGEHGEFRGRGLLARFLYSLPESLVGSRKYRNRPISAEARSAYEQAVGTLLDLPISDVDEIPKLRLEGEALSLWTQYHDDVEQAQADGGRLVHIRDWASKLSGKVARIAGVLHMVENRTHPEPWAVPISQATVAAAWALGEYYTAHALAAFELMNEEPNSRCAKTLLRWILRRDEPTFSGRDCHQAHRRLGDGSADFKPYLRILESRGYIRRLAADSTAPRAGRPSSPAFEVNPLILTQNTQNSTRTPNLGGFEYFESSESRPIS